MPSILRLYPENHLQLLSELLSVNKGIDVLLSYHVQEHWHVEFLCQSKLYLEVPGISYVSPSGRSFLLLLHIYRAKLQAIVVQATFSDSLHHSLSLLHNFTQF